MTPPVVHRAHSSPPTLRQHFALMEEVNISIRLLQSGLSHLQRISGADDFYHLPILLLSGGCERLMKCILCLERLEKTGRYPLQHELPKTHDLTNLLDKIVRNCYDSTYRRRPAAQSDLAYLATDQSLRDIVRILSDFGQGARYYNLNVVLSVDSELRDPEQMWKEIESAVGKAHPAWPTGLLDPVLRAEIWRAIISDLVARIEAFARALARLFTLGPLGDQAKKMSGLIGPFLLLRDQDLGHRLYSEYGSIAGART